MFKKQITIKSAYEIMSIAYDLSSLESARNRFKYGVEPRANQPFNGIIKDDVSLEKIFKIAEQSGFPDEEPLRLKFYKKWKIDRGGSFSYDILKKGLLNYYNGDNSSIIIDKVKEVLQWGVNKIRYIYGETQPIHFRYKSAESVRFTTVLEWYKADHRSNGGIAYNGDRRKHVVEDAIAFKKQPLQLDPLIGGMRLLDKYRNIFMDSSVNYFREACAFQPLFKFIDSLSFNHHYSVEELAKLLINAKSKYAFGGDYKGMDMHIFEEIAIEVIRSLYALSDASPELQAYGESIIHQLFNATIIVGEEAWQGVNQLLSGIYPTHDLESWMNFCINGFIAERYLHKFVVPFGTALNKHTASVVVCGDDVILLLGEKTAETISAMKLAYPKVAGWFGQIIEMSKCDEGVDRIFFCKRYWALHPSVPGRKFSDGYTPIPVYSIHRAIWGLRHPEEIKKFPTRKGLLVWAASILDNASGCKMYEGVVRAVVELNYDFFCAAACEDLTPEDIIELNKEWNFRTISAFNIETSPSISLFKQVLSEHGISVEFAVPHK